MLRKYKNSKQANSIYYFCSSYRLCLDLVFQRYLSIISIWPQKIEQLLVGIQKYSLFKKYILFIFYVFFSIESFRPSIFMSTGLPDKNGFDLGSCENLKQIFGNCWWKALLPIKTRYCHNNDIFLGEDDYNYILYISSHDGIYYPLSSEQTLALSNAAASNTYLTNPNSTDSLLLNNRLTNINHSKISLE